MSHTDTTFDGDDDTEMADIQEQEEQKIDATSEESSNARKEEENLDVGTEVEGRFAERGHGPVRNPHDLAIISQNDRRELASENARANMPVYLHEGYSEAMQMPMEHAPYRSHNDRGDQTSHTEILRARFARNREMRRNAHNTLRYILHHGSNGAPSQPHARPRQSGILPFVGGASSHSFADTGPSRSERIPTQAPAQDHASLSAETEPSQSERALNQAPAQQYVGPAQNDVLPFISGVSGSSSTEAVTTRWQRIFERFQKKAEQKKNPSSKHGRKGKDRE